MEGLRINQGSLKGRKILVAPNKGIKPIGGRLRHEVLGLVKDFIPGARVLELFAGTGIIGIEMLSMGAIHVSFVDKSRAAIDYLEKNIKRFSIPKSKVQVYRKDALEFLIWAIRRGFQYDIVFLDPPFDKLLGLSLKKQEEYIRELLDRTDDVLSSKGVILLKLHKKIQLGLPKGLVVYTVKRSGINRVYVILKEKEIDPRFKKEFASEKESLSG